MEGLVISIKNAASGLRLILRQERNARIHLALAIAALAAGLLLGVSDIGLAAMFFAVILVFLAEIFNSAIEKTLDLVEPTVSVKVAEVKDMAAGGVLVAAIAAAAIGAVVLLPKLTGWTWL